MPESPSHTVHVGAGQQSTEPASAGRFASRVDDYVRYRPGYPPAMMAWLRDVHGIDAAQRVADVGAGTGISTRMWLEAGHRVVGIEPSAAMRGAAQAWLQDFPGASWIDATAEATTLPDAGVDIVSAAQAFHWFDMASVRVEWARILRPGGQAVVFWNSRLLTGSAFLEGYEALLRAYGTDYTQLAERYQDDATMAAWFGAGHAGTAQFANRQRIDFEGLRGRLLSSSYAPQPGDPRHAAMLDALRVLFDRSAVDGHVDFDYSTRVFVGGLH